MGAALALALTSLALIGNALDQQRIATQLEQVEAELRARDVSSWPAELRTVRARNLDRLRAYRLRGEFPRNSRHPGACAPYFIDDGGRACAVAQLVIDSGHGELAHEIAATENNDLLGDIHHELLLEWIARSGLTAEECAHPAVLPLGLSATAQQRLLQGGATGQLLLPRACGRWCGVRIGPNQRVSVSVPRGRVRVRGKSHRRNVLRNERLRSTDLPGRRMHAHPRCMR